MADTNNEIYAQQYSENIMQLAQQQTSKLWGAVYQKTNVKGKQFYQDQIGQWQMSPKAGRNPQTPSSDPNLARRMAPMLDYHDNVLLDRSDELKVISDPRSAYTIAAGKAIGRQMDDRIISALGSDAFTGETGSVTTSLPSSQIIVDGATGLTFDKVKQSQRILNDNDVEEDERFFVTSPQGIEDLMGEEKATSSDYSTLRAIQNGTFAGQSWMGFQWIMSTRLNVAANIRESFAFHKYGVCAGLPTLPFVRTDERADLSYSWQVYYELNIGTTRLEEDRVVRVDILES
jgi:hypothetical protein